jgi:hypothetical protein
VLHDQVSKAPHSLKPNKYATPVRRDSQSTAKEAIRGKAEEIGK